MQVQRMADVFREAQRVIAWFGHDKRAEPAVDYFKKISLVWDSPCTMKEALDLIFDSLVSEFRCALSSTLIDCMLLGFLKC